MCLLSPLFLLGLAACAGISPDERTQSARQLAAQAGWQAEAIEARRFRLLSLHPTARATDTLAVFIEGDGLAWLDSSTPSADPIPRTPVGLQVALAEPRLAAAYLGRPCQYDPEGTPQRCRTADWTNARFSAEIVAAMNVGVGQLKQRFQARQLVLVGYSGGATIAALLATRRDDVAQLITVASLLDHAEWTRQMRESPLNGSLNPADEWDRLQQIPQLHYIGDKDRQAGRIAMRPALERPGPQTRVIDLPDFDHGCCWAQAWPQLAGQRAQ